LTGNLTPGLSFVHNLCCKCPNGSCKTIFDIYTSRISNGTKNTSRRGVLTPTIELWILRVLKDSQVPISGVWVSSSHSFKVWLWQLLSFFNTIIIPSPCLWLHKCKRHCGATWHYGFVIVVNITTWWFYTNIKISILFIIIFNLLKLGNNKIPLILVTFGQ
jgi:hypothetical protein